MPDRTREDSDSDHKPRAVFDRESRAVFDREPKGLSSMTMRTVPLRRVPGDSIVHRLWAGTKLIVVLALGILTWVLPSWPALGLVAAVVVITALIAGIPLGAIPGRRGGSGG